MTASTPIGYVVTHYPRVALTFISGEIAAIEQRGFTVYPFAMNEPNAADLAAPDAEREQARTVYLKANWARTFGAYAGEKLRHPFAVAGVALGALASAGPSPGLMARRLSHLFQAALVARECRRHGIHHLHAHFGLAPAMIARLASSMINRGGGRCSFSFTIHGFHDFVEPKVSRLDLKAADAAFVACISDYTRSQLCQATDPALWSKFHVVRCGINLNAFAFRPARKMAARARIVSVGRLSPEKGFAVLLDAIAMLKERGKEVELLLIGDGPSRATLEQQTAQLGITGQVSFAGEQVPERVRALLAEADIFCLPSFNEGLPVSIMEAMAIGVPVVTSGIAGIPELAINGITALTVPPANAERLAGAIELIAGDPELAAAMVVEARTAVERMHDQEKNADQLAALFREAVK